MSNAAENDAPTWCDGTPHSPDAIPPLPVHDWRFDADNPWAICARCGERDAPEPLSEGGFRYSDRAAILCRTCMRPIAWDTRTEPGYLPRTGWYDDARSDPIVCFKALGYRHEPLTDREWAYYEAGQRSVLPHGSGHANA